MLSRLPTVNIQFDQFYYSDHIWLFCWYVTTTGGRSGSGRMVVGFITNYALSVYHHKRCEFESCSGEVYSIQHYVIKFVSDFWQVGGFLRFPPPKK